MEQKKRTLIIVVLVSLVILCIVSIGISQYVKYQQNNASSTPSSIILHVDYTRSEDERGNFSVLNVTKIDANYNISNILTLSNVSFNWVGYKEIYHENDYPHDDSNMVTIASGKFIDIINANINSPVIYYDCDGDQRLSINDSIRINLYYKNSDIKISMFDLFVDSSSDHVRIHILSNNQKIQLD